MTVFADAHRPIDFGILVPHYFGEPVPTGLGGNGPPPRRHRGGEELLAWQSAETLFDAIESVRSVDRRRD